MKHKAQNKLNMVSPFAESLEENPFIHWCLTNGRNLLLLFFTLIALFLIAYRILFGNMVKSELNFISAENDYQHFMTEKNPLALQETLQKFKKIFEAHPELKAKYEGLIAQHLLLEGDTSMALPFATSALNRTESENKPFYHDYSENTLLIAQKKYSKALEQSLNLKTILQNQSSDNLLFALNLMRIGMLQQQLKLEKDELITWKEWESKMNEKNNKESFQKIVDIFSIGQISLTKYIETRIKLLS